MAARLSYWHDIIEATCEDRGRDGRTPSKFKVANVVVVGYHGSDAAGDEGNYVVVQLVEVDPLPAV